MTLIRPTRRDILKLAAIAPGLALPAVARASLGAPEGGNPAHFRFRLGEVNLTILSDGWFTQPVNRLGINADPAEVQAFLSSHYLDPQTNLAHTNHLLIETGDAKVLVDVGSGARFVDTTGRLMANMEEAGIDPGEITHVFITHAHPDHIWGIRDDFDEALFPDAAYFIGESEFTYWMQDGLATKVAAADQQFVVGAVNSLNADGVEWNLVQNGAEIVPGVSVIDTPGHTAGHMGLRLDSGDKSLFAVGDSLSHGWMSFAHPEWYNGIDAIPDQTVATRQRLLDMAAADGVAMVGYHFPFPGVGHVIRDGGSYRFVPALWQFGQ